MLGRLRERYEAAMVPVGRLIGRAGLSPNSLTMLSTIAGAASGWFYFASNLVLGALLILFSGTIDMLDGAVARATGVRSRFGAVLDHVLDRYAEYFILTGIALGGYVHWSLGLFTLFGMLMASFTRAKAESVGGLKSCTVGLAERQEKLILIAVGSLMEYWFQGLLQLALLAVGLLSHITVIQRLHYTWRQTRGAEH